MNGQQNRVALYARVSTRDKGQDTENQLKELREYCNRMPDYEIVAEYIDHISGSKRLDRREAGAKMFQDAAEHRFDLLLFWSIDRFSREGLARTLEYLQRLNSYNVKFRSFKQPELSTDNELIRDLLLTVYASLAKIEREMISERTKSALAVAKERGTRLGARPKHGIAQKIARLQNDGIGKKAAARQLGVALNTVKKYWVKA